MKNRLTSLLVHLRLWSRQTWRRLRIVEFRLKRKHPRVPRLRWLALAGLMLFSSVLPTVQFLLQSRQYTLSPAVKALVGTPNKNLASKIAYKAASDSWQFNADGIPIGNSIQSAGMPSLNDLKAQIGGGGEKDNSLYAVDMPTSGKKGVTYYDTNTNLSFTLVPTFQVGDGKQVEGHLVYPSEKGSQLIYTAKTNGMKEDIILPKSIGDTAEFTYKLELPDTLEAKIQDDGSLGVFSPNPVLFGKISDDQDQEKILSARKTAAKDHLLFVLPAPFIKQAGNKDAPASSARFQLHGKTLTVSAKGLTNLNYPITVDPSVVVTSSSDFGSGSGDNIEYGSDQINRSAVTGGSLENWSDGSVYDTTTVGMGTAIVNGRLYVVGGNNGGTIEKDVTYTQVSAGTFGTWASDANNLSTARTFHGFAAYNGYLYAVGGMTSGGAILDSVEYAPINTDGSVGVWTTTSSLPVPNALGRAVAYNGYLYLLGGSEGSTIQNSVHYAPIKADGSLGTWNTTSGFTTGRVDGNAFAYNEKLYILSGSNGSGTYYNDVQYASINDDGTLGGWTATSNFNTSRAGAFAGVHNGYAYIAGGTTTENSSGTAFNDVQYAPVHANGTLGQWLSTTSLSLPRYSGGVAFSNGYMYVVGGIHNGTGTRSVQYAAISPAGSNSTVNSGTTFTTKRRGFQSIIYNNYIYQIGGTNETNTNTIRMVAIDANGSVGSASSARALPAALSYFAAVAYRGYLYVLGGCTSAFSSCSDTANNVTTVYRSAISPTDGSLGTWSAQTSFTTARYGLSAVAHGGYLYIIGGLNGSTFQNDIQYHAIGSGGEISGAWTTSTHTIPSARAYMGAAVDGGRLYIAGGCSAGALTCSSTLNDIQYTTLNPATGDLTSAFTANSTSFTNARGMLGFVIDNGYVYTIGGWGGGSTYYNDIQFAPLNSAGSLGNWTTGQPLPQERYAAGYATNKGYLYVSGGGRSDANRYENTVYYTKLNTGGSGTVSTSWAKTTGPLSGAQRYGIAYSDKYVYVAGGITGGSVYKDGVYYAQISSDGTIGSWTATTSLGTARSDLALYVVGGYIYAVGGNNGSALSVIEYAQINSDGSLGAWTATSSGLAGPRQMGGYATYNNHIYYLGGHDGSNEKTEVYYATLPNGGDPSSLSSTTPLPHGIRLGASVAYNGYLYIIGGTASSGAQSQILYAAINSNGSLGNWNIASWMPGNGPTSAVAANGMLYLLGSSDDLTATLKASIRADGTLGAFEYMTDISTAPDQVATKAMYAHGYIYSFQSSGDISRAGVDSQTRTARYQKRINLGSEFNITGLSHGGTQSILRYRLASAAASYGATRPISALGSESSTVCGSGDSQYIQVMAQLDDTYTAVYPDLNTASITDITLNYQGGSRAPTELRLRHGQFFQDETQRPLDTCQ